MNDQYNLQRFVDAQKENYAIASAEIKRGGKQSHWMWFIFPQIKGLGFSATSKFYAIKDVHEAEVYLQHPLLGIRLIEICNELLKLATDNANEIFGAPDDMKLQSSMTLFSSIHQANPVFGSVLRKFFNGVKDENTLQIIGK